MGILEKLFQKRGIKSPDELSPEERKDYDNWRKILSKEELTIGDIKEFCATQVSIIENKWKDYNTKTEDKAHLIPYHTVYKTLLQAIDSPKSARESLEATLNNLLNA